MDIDCPMGDGPVRTERGCASHFHAFPSTRGQLLDRASSCVICLEPIEEGADLTSLLGCEDRHHFHANCINSWLERNATCPTCRRGATKFPFLRRMSASPNDPAVQYEGLVAIVKTASVEGPPQYSIQNVNRLSELGACQLVAAAMRTFAGERCIQLLGLEAIEALSAKSEAARARFEEEAAEALFGRIFELFVHDKVLQAAACQALVGLATGHPGWQTRLGAAGLCWRVAEMLRRWPDDYGTQLSGLYALNALLARHEANLQRVLDAGAPAVLVRMMRAFWRDLEVLDGAVTAIYVVCARGPVERGMLGQLDCGRVLLAVMAAHPDARTIQVKCSFALAKLCWQHEPNRRRLIGLRAALVVTRVLNQHPTDLPVQVAGAAAMVALYMPSALMGAVAASTTAVRQHHHPSHHHPHKKTAHHHTHLTTAATNALAHAIVGSSVTTRRGVAIMASSASGPCGSDSSGGNSSDGGSETSNTGGSSGPACAMDVDRDSTEPALSTPRTSSDGGSSGHSSDGDGGGSGSNSSGRNSGHSSDGDGGSGSSGSGGEAASSSCVPAPPPSSSSSSASAATTVPHAHATNGYGHHHHGNGNGSGGMEDGSEEAGGGVSVPSSLHHHPKPLPHHHSSQMSWLGGGGSSAGSPPRKHPLQAKTTSAETAALLSLSSPDRLGPGTHTSTTTTAAAATGGLSAGVGAEGTAPSSDGMPEALAFQALIRALASLPAEPELELSASPALLFLLEAVDGRQPLLDDPEAAQLFVTALRNYARDEDSQDILLEVAILLTDDRPQACEALILAGIAPHVLELMARYLPVASLQEKCCMLLASLTEENARNIERVWSPEATARLAGAMLAHPGHAGVQHFALSCLQNLAEDGGDGPRAQLTDPATLRLVARALAFHPHDDDVGNAALGLVASLAAEACGTEHGPPYVASALALLGAVWAHIHAAYWQEPAPAPTPTTTNGGSNGQSSHGNWQGGDEGLVHALGLLRWLTLVARDCTPEEATTLAADPAIPPLIEEVAGRLHTHTQHPAHNHTTASMEGSSQQPQPHGGNGHGGRPRAPLAEAEAHGVLVCLELLAALPQRGLPAAWPRACGVVVEGLQDPRGDRRSALAATRAVRALAEGHKGNRDILQGLGAGKGLAGAVARLGVGEEHPDVRKALAAMA